jgi:ribosomal protein S12 methylthiotransferase accessory factor
MDVRGPKVPRLRIETRYGRSEYRTDLRTDDEARSIWLGLGVHATDDRGSATAFASWAQSHSVPLLTVATGPGRAVIGPMTIPGRVGCAHCAQERMRAAAAATGSETAAGGDEDPDAVLVARLVTAELHAIEESGASETGLVDHVDVVDAGSSEVTRHRVIPMPRCRVCGGAARLRDSEKTSRGRVEDFAGWVDPVTGVIPALLVDPPPLERSSLPIVVTAMPPHVVDDDGSLRQLPAGWGKGLSPSEAVRSAVGEALERYSASLTDPDRIVWARPDCLDGDRLDPREFPLYTDEQYGRCDFPYRRFDETIEHPWVLGRWLNSDEDVWIPAVLAFLSVTIGPEHLFCQGTSNGLAASVDPVDAALRATLELVERDAMMVAWLTGASGQRIDVDAEVDPQLRSALDAISSVGGSPEVYLLPTSVCGTTMVCLALGDGVSWPGITMGLGADLDPTAALRAAVLELYQTGPYLAHLLRSRGPEVPRAPGFVREMLDHATFYFPRERARAFDRLRASNTRISFNSIPAWEGDRSLASCASALETAGVRVALVDVTSSDLATGPYRVMRAVSPDLQPISYGHGLEFAPLERISNQALSNHSAIHPIW